MADIKPRSSDNIDNIRSCKVPDIVDSSQLKAVQLPDPLLASKVVQLLYTNSGVALLALASDTMHKLWKWQRTEHNPSGKSSASIKPELWQPATGALMTNYTSDTKPAEESSGCIALSKNDSYLLSASGGKVSLFNMITFKIMTTFMPPPPAATCLAFDPHDNNFCAVGMEDSTIQIYSVRVDEVKAKLKGHQKQITGLAFSQTLDILVSAGADAQLCIWDTEGWEKKKARPIQAPPGHPSPLVGETKVQFHNDQTHLLVVHESQIAVYDSQLRCLQSIQEKEQSVWASALSCLLYFVCDKGKIRRKKLEGLDIRSKCSNTLKSGGRGNFQHDSLLAENMVRTKDDIPPQDPKQNKRKGKPCKLAIGSIGNIVAHGMVYERIEHNEAIHTVPLGESNVRVSVEVVIQKDAPLPIPIPDEMFIVGEAVGFFVVWPKNLVLVGDEGASINVECGKYQESIQSFVSLVEHIKYDEAIDIPLEKDIFGEEINIQLQRVDMEYICHIKELSVTCIMLYISHLHQVLKASNWRKQFVFVNPCLVSGKTMAGEKSKSVLLARRLEEAMLEQLVLIPYNIGYHWILLVIYFPLMQEMKSQCDEKMFDFVFCQKFLGEMQNMVKEFNNLVFSSFLFLIFNFYFFTEDFDFDAMNAKFNKEEIWGHLRKSNKNRMEDEEGDENDNSANDAEEEDEDGLPNCDVKNVYVKDDFFDSLSCLTLDGGSGRGRGRGRAKFSEQKKIDIETFGEVPRHQRGHPGWVGQSRGSHRGRGYHYVGRGRGESCDVGRAFLASDIYHHA